MKQYRIRAVFLFMLMTVLGITISPPVAASEATELPMSIKAILPANQKAGVNGYFDLQVNPDEKQTIYIEIKNNKSEDIVVNLSRQMLIPKPPEAYFTMWM